MGGTMWGMKLALVMVGVLVMVPETMQLNMNHPVASAAQRLNLQYGPFIGLIISSPRDEKTLKNSSLFTPVNNMDSVLTYAGRSFHIGLFNGFPAIYVLAGEPMSNVGATTQMLLDMFHISGIICYGSSATVSNGVFITNVVIPSQVTYTSSWEWAPQDGVRVAPGFNIGDYNLPEAGENALGSVHFSAVPVYKSSSTKKKMVYDIDVHSEWVNLASQLNFGDDRLTVHFGKKVGSSDVYLKNQAYASVLSNQLGVSAVDTESAAVVTTAIANDVPHIVVRGASNRPGLPSDKRLSEVTSKNVLKVVAQFVEAAYTPVSPRKYSIV
ncbi:unnamed protein product [Amaranthus hypochondriacus]